jgi:hypothetical protein
VTKRLRLIACILDNFLLMLIMFVTGFGIGLVAGMTPLEILDAAWQAMAFVGLLYYVSFWAMIGGTPGKLCSACASSAGMVRSMASAGDARS